MNIEQIKAKIQADNQPRPNNIETADFAQAAPKPPTPLTWEEVNQLCGALARIDELKRQPASLLVEDRTTSGDTTKLTREAELTALTEFLAGGLLNHASEFLGALVALRTEYMPLVQALAPVLRHVLAQQPSAPLSNAVKAEAAAKE